MLERPVDAPSPKGVALRTMICLGVDTFNGGITGGIGGRLTLRESLQNPANRWVLRNVVG